MPRKVVTPKEQVINFYLKAPLEELDEMQTTLRAIYRHRDQERSATSTDAQQVNRDQHTEHALNPSERAHKAWATKRKKLAVAAENAARSGGEGEIRKEGTPDQSHSGGD